MDNAKKLAVVPQELLDSLKFNQEQQMGPIGKKMLDIDREMQSILNRDDLDQYRKAQLYTQTLAKYIDYREQFRTPPTIPVAANLPTEEEEEENNESSRSRLE